MLMMWYDKTVDGVFCSGTSGSGKLVQVEVNHENGKHFKKNALESVSIPRQIKK